ncbi:NAD(P)H-dependent oxidoreductase [Paenibacillus sp. TRM 82003]|nr:NAD(P)H-dependent oxidoreductase [Paenibacillus sp. TRM 82003]
MKTLVIVAHPDLCNGSRMNRRLVEALRGQAGITVHDIYEAYPNGAIDVDAEHRLLESHDKVVFQFPLYWYSSPYLLKKWLDDVLTFGWAYGPGGDKLHGKSLGLAITTGGPESSFQAGGYNQFSMSEITKPFQAMAHLVGFTFLPLFTAHGSKMCTDDTLEALAHAYVEYALEGAGAIIHG